MTLRRTFPLATVFFTVLMLAAGTAWGACQQTASKQPSRPCPSEHDPFGGSRSTTGSGPVNNIRFAGQQLDDTGLYHMGARQYDSSTGRFTSTDPLEWPVGLPYMNAYQYAFNNPLVYTDPSGAWPGEGAVTSFANSQVASGIVNIGRGATGGFTDNVADRISSGSSSTVEQNAWQQGIGAVGGLAVGGLGGRIGAGIGLVSGVGSVGTEGYDCLTAGGKPSTDAGMANRATECRNAAIGVALIAAPGVGRWLGGRGSTPCCPFPGAADRIPSGWGPGGVTNKPGGWRWSDPSNPNTGVRIDTGRPNSSFPSQQVDHVVVNNNGQVIGPNGMPISGPIKDNPQAHIPLTDWMGWSGWSSP